MLVNRVSPASLCSNDSCLAGREGSQCSSLQNADQASSMDLFSQSGSSQSQQGKEHSDIHHRTLEKQPSGQKYYMKFLSQLAKQDAANVSTCTAEQRSGGVAHSKQSLNSWNASQQEKTESKQLHDVLGKLKEDLVVQVTEQLVTTVRAEMSRGLASQEKTSSGPYLDPQYACILTQLLQGQAEARQDMLKMSERLEHLTSQVCRLEGVVSEQLSRHTAVFSSTVAAMVPSSDRWEALNVKLDHTYSKLDMFISSEQHRDTALSSEHHRDTVLSSEHHRDTVLSSEHHRDTVLSSEHHRDTVLSSEQHRDTVLSSEQHRDTVLSSEQHRDTVLSSEHHRDTVPSKRHNTVFSAECHMGTIVSHDQTVPQPSADCAPLESEESMYHTASITGHGLGTPPEHTHPSHQLRSRDQPNILTLYEPDGCGSLKKRCTQPPSRNKATRRGGGAISVLSTPITRRRSKRVHSKMADEATPVLPTDSPFSALNSHKPVLSTDSVHMSGQFQRSIEALRRRMSVMSDMSTCGEAMKEIIEALKQQNHRNYSP